MGRVAYVSERGSSVVVTGRRATIDLDHAAEGVCVAAAPSVDFEDNEGEGGPALLGDCVCHGPFFIKLRPAPAIDQTAGSPETVETVPGASEGPALLELLFVDDGTVRAIYRDELLPLIAALGEGHTERASHVEPLQAGWCADMEPSGGPLLLGDDGRPFPTRAAALAAEVSWLRANNLGAA